MNQNEQKEALCESKKSKKQKAPWSRKKKRIVLCSAFAALGVGVGALGFMLFGHTAPKNNYDAVFPGYDYLALKKNNSFSNISANAKTPKAQAVRAVNTGLYKRSVAKYSLRYRTQVVNVKIGNTKQNIEAFTYFSPERNFNQNISSSSFVHTADRYYDKKDGKVELYSGGTPDKWKDAEAKEYSYDERMDTRGKLVAPLYFIGQDKKGTRNFVSYHSEDSGWNTQESGIINFDLSEDSVTDAKRMQQGSKHRITITRDSQHTIGYKKMARQRRRTGGLKSLPDFKSISIDFTLDSNLNITKIVTSCDYIASRAGIKAECVSKDETYVYTSDTPFKDKENKELTFPSPHEETGDKNTKDESKLLAYARGLSK